MKNSFFTFVIFLGLMLSINAQDTVLDPDKSLEEARKQAFEGNRVQARESLEEILKQYPEYVDVQTLMAQTHSWDGNYNEARKLLNRITSKHRDNRDAWQAAVRNEVYAENDQLALGLANKSLGYLQEDEVIESIRRNILEKNRETQVTTTEQQVETPKGKHTLGIYNALEVFSDQFDPMYYNTVEYQLNLPKARIIPRINHAYRFQTSGWQAEIDAYPKFSEKWYAYLNYGFGASEIFPRHRAGAEVYHNLPKGMEVSLGGRYLSFQEQNALISTASFGIYRGNYYLSLRPYYSMVNGRNGGFSGALDLRRYLSTKYHYIGLKGNYGFTTEIKQLFSGTTLLAESLLFVSSQQALLEYQFPNKGQNMLYQAQLGVTRQEFVSTPGVFFWALSTGLRIQWQL